MGVPNKKFPQIKDKKHFLPKFTIREKENVFGKSDRTQGSLPVEIIKNPERNQRLPASQLAISLWDISRIFFC